MVGRGGARYAGKPGKTRTAPSALKVVPVKGLRFQQTAGPAADHDAHLLPEIVRDRGEPRLGEGLQCGGQRKNIGSRHPFERQAARDRVAGAEIPDLGPVAGEKPRCIEQRDRPDSAYAVAQGGGEFGGIVRDGIDRPQPRNHHTLFVIPHCRRLSLPPIESAPVRKSSCKIFFRSGRILPSFSKGFKIIFRRFYPNATMEEKQHKNAAKGGGEKRI